MGWRRSPSIKQVLPCCAKAAAKLIATVLLPSPAAEEATRMTLGRLLLQVWCCAKREASAAASLLFRWRSQSPANHLRRIFGQRRCPKITEPWQESGDSPNSQYRPEFESYYSCLRARRKRSRPAGSPAWHRRQ